MDSVVFNNIYPATKSAHCPDGMNLVNDHLAHNLREQGLLQPPNEFGYIHLAGEIEGPRLLWRSSAKKRSMLQQLKEAAEALRRSEMGKVQRVDVFDAFLFPPGAAREARHDLAQLGLDTHLAKFDVVLLVECSTVETARQVRNSAAFTTCQQLLEEAASYVHCITAKNLKRIAEVDKTENGVFLFNYFVAADNSETGVSGEEMLSAVWEYTAGWWTANVNLTNSTPLLPIPEEVSEYTLINHCRWDSVLDVVPHLALNTELRRFVLANFRANKIVAMPVLYRLA